MEEENTQGQASQSPSDQSPRTRVGFPQQQEPRKFPTKIIIIIFIFLLLAAGGWFIFGRQQNDSILDEQPSPTPFEVEEFTPTPTPEEVDREGIEIQVLNGTGIAGGAGSLKTKLEGLGYSQIEVGNASTQDFTATEVIFNESVPEATRDEIQELLEDAYQDVNVEEDSLDKYDMRITTGLPKGQTATPTKAKTTATPTPKVTVKPTGGTATPTGSPTVSPTVTASPTPTP